MKKLIAVDDAMLELRLELAQEILSNVHGKLCRDKKLDQAEELMEIMRRIVLLSEKLEV